MVGENVILQAHTCDEDIIKRIQAIMNGCHAVLSELQMVISADGISLRQLDVSKAAMVHWNLPSSAFTGYEYQHKDKEYEICLDVGGMKRSVATAKHRLEFYLTDTRENDGVFSVLGFSDFKHVERLPLLIPADKRTKKPTLQYDVGLGIKGKLFKKVIKTVKKVSTHMDLIVAEKTLPMTLVIEAEGLDGDEYRAEIEIDPHDCRFGATFVKDFATTFYATNYMNEFCKFILNNDMVHVTFSTNKPIKLAMEKDGVSVELILAPRVMRR